MKIKLHNISAGAYCFVSFTLRECQKGQSVLIFQEVAAHIFSEIQGSIHSSRSQSNTFYLHKSTSLKIFAFFFLGVRALIDS